MLYLQGKKSLFLFPSFFSYTHLHTCIHTHLQHKTIFLPLVKTRETDSEHGSFIANSNNRTNNNILQPPEQKKKGRREEEHGEKPLIQQYPGSFRSNRNRFLDMIKHLSVVYTPQFQNLPKTSPFSSRQPATATTTIITASGTENQPTKSILLFLHQATSKKVLGKKTDPKPNNTFFFRRHLHRTEKILHPTHDVLAVTGINGSAAS